MRCDDYLCLTALWCATLTDCSSSLLLHLFLIPPRHRTCSAALCSSAEIRYRSMVILAHSFTRWGCDNKICAGGGGDVAMQIADKPKNCTGGMQKATHHTERNCPSTSQRGANRTFQGGGTTKVNFSFSVSETTTWGSRRRLFPQGAAGEGEGEKELQFE